MSPVRSVLPESTTKISQSRPLILARHRGRFSSLLNVRMTTDTVGRVQLPARIIVGAVSSSIPFLPPDTAIEIDQTGGNGLHCESLLKYETVTDKAGTQAAV